MSQKMIYVLEKELVFRDTEAVLAAASVHTFILNNKTK